MAWFWRNTNIKQFFIDLRRTRRHQTKCLNEIKKEFEKSKSIRYIKVITKMGKLIELSKKA